MLEKSHGTNGSTKQGGPTARCPYAPSYAVSDDNEDDDGF